MIKKKAMVVVAVLLIGFRASGGGLGNNPHGQTGYKIVACTFDDAFRNGIGRTRDCFRGRIAYSLVDARPGLMEGMMDIMGTQEAKTFADELVGWCNSARLRNMFLYTRGAPPAGDAVEMLAIALAAWVAATNESDPHSSDWRPIATRMLDQIGMLKANGPKEARLVAYSQLSRALMYPDSQKGCEALRRVSDTWRSRAPHIALRALEHLGTRLEMLGQEESAKAVYREVVETYPGYSKWEGYLNAMVKTNGGTWNFSGAHSSCSQPPE